MRGLLMLSVLIISLVAICLAQTEERITITTYYPSPYGVYRNMRIYPSNLPTTGVDRGVMYYNDSENILRYWNNTAWVNLTETPCMLKTYNATSGMTNCDPGYYTSTFANASPTGGDMLCCKVINPP